MQTLLCLSDSAQYGRSEAWVPYLSFDTGQGVYMKQECSSIIHKHNLLIFHF